MENYINVFNNEDNFKFESIQILCPPSVPPHFHNQYELLFFETGDASYMVEGNYYDLSEGDLLITNPREMHCPVFKTNREYQRNIIFFTPSYLSDFISDKYNPFSALENRKIGITLNEYITQKRIMLAKEYLMGGIPPSQVYSKVGFWDYSSFYRAFKKTLGYSPSSIKLK